MNVRQENLSDRPKATFSASPPRTLALGITTLKEHGFGAQVRLQVWYFALDASYALMPVLVSWRTLSGTHLKFELSQHADSSVVLFLHSNTKRQHGLRLGGALDKLAGPGAIVGYVGETLWGRFGAGFGVGVQYYPELAERFTKHLELEPGSLSELSAIQFYLSVNLLWYLL